MSDVEDLRNMLEGAFDKARFDAIFYRAQNKEMYRIVYLVADTNSHPWKWRTEPYNGADKLPEPLRKRHMKDDA